MALARFAGSAACPAGVLLVGHGTRSPRGREEFLTLAQAVAERIDVPVECGFLELAEPTIAAATARLVDRGVRHIVVAPLLLFAAGHAKDDIPQAVARALAALGATDVTALQVGHLGCHPSIVELSARWFTETLQVCHPLPAADTCLLLVGRGSRDESATAEMHEFARLRAEQSPVGSTSMAFLAMARPNVQEILPELGRQGWKRVVIQPQLLFHGDLYDTLSFAVENCRKEWPQTEWVATAYLGMGLAENRLVRDLLCEAIGERIQAAVGRGGGRDSAS
jgi:sirohydrochlorin cobaltochelatase